MKRSPRRRSPWYTPGVRCLSTLALIAFLAVACSGDSDPPGNTTGKKGDLCAKKAECTGALECIGPSEPMRCGVPPREGCATSADCTGGPCHAIADTCSEDGVGSACGSACTATSCGPGFLCGADGACRAKRCDEGATCRAYEKCDVAAIPASAPVHARHTGCQRIACADDTGCPSGTACVNGVCHAGKGTCGDVVVVP